MYAKDVNGLIYWLNYVNLFFQNSLYLYSYLHLLEIKVKSHAYEDRI